MMISVFPRKNVLGKEGGGVQGGVWKVGAGEWKILKSLVRTNMDGVVSDFCVKWD